jgi:hypothetical protein
MRDKCSKRENQRSRRHAAHRLRERERGEEGKKKLFRYDFPFSPFSSAFPTLPAL